ncbi:hypothetical protein, partial [Anaplasma phagocytophilum]|uniref:hypothetical protein n=1 Tax=Anaplasma phagocytophilum TaxID=948 RepID=UPI00201A32CC
MGPWEGTEIFWGRNDARNALFYVRSDEVTRCICIGRNLVMYGICIRRLWRIIEWCYSESKYYCRGCMRALLRDIIK